MQTAAGRRAEVLLADKALWTSLQALDRALYREAASVTD